MGSFSKPGRGHDHAWRAGHLHEREAVARRALLHDPRGPLLGLFEARAVGRLVGHGIRRIDHQHAVRVSVGAEDRHGVFQEGLGHGRHERDDQQRAHELAGAIVRCWIRRVRRFTAASRKSMAAQAVSRYFRRLSRWISHGAAAAASQPSIGRLSKPKANSGAGNMGGKRTGTGNRGLVYYIFSPILFPISLSRIFLALWDQRIDRAFWRPIFHCCTFSADFRCHDNHPRMLGKFNGRIERAHQAIFDNTRHGQGASPLAAKMRFNRRDGCVMRQFRQLHLRLGSNLVVVRPTLRIPLIGFWNNHNFPFSTRR